MSNDSKRYTTWAYRKQRESTLARWRAEGLPCYRCHRPIDWSCKYPDPGSATFEHIVPVALGGALVPAPEDCAVSHWSCNSRHGARMQAKMKGGRIGRHEKGQQAAIDGVSAGVVPGHQEGVKRGERAARNSARAVFDPPAPEPRAASNRRHRPATPTRRPRERCSPSGVRS